jgi:hypothetical protein
MLSKPTNHWYIKRGWTGEIDAADATLVRHDGRFWIFASLSGEGRSSWDAMGLFYSDRLEGPWQAHRANPVLIDAGQARPAGAFFRHGDQLIRPAQDCRGGYGRGISLCRIDRLDPEAYQQTRIDSLIPAPDFKYNGLHMLNRVGPWEVIDVRGWRNQIKLF